MLFAERDENDLLSTFADKGHKLLRCDRRCVRVHKVPVINSLDHQLESLTIIQPGMLQQRHQAHLDCAADIAEALLTVFLDYTH